MPEKRVGICLPQKTWQERGTAACIVYNSSELGKSVDELSFVPQIFIALSLSSLGTNLTTLALARGRVERVKSSACPNITYTPRRCGTVRQLLIFDVFLKRCWPRQQAHK